MKIVMTFGDLKAEAELNESETAKRIAQSLPIEGSVRRWGKEIYFPIPIRAGQALNAREQVEVGDLGYWPPGKAFCIFFGPTPASIDEKPRAASAVNLIGRMIDNPRELDAVREGTAVTIAAATDEDSDR